MNIWEQVLARIETKVGRHPFYSWFRPTSFVSEDRSSITVRVPNPMFKDWLTNHYSGVIREALTEVSRPNFTLNFVSEAHSDAAAIQLSADEAAALESGAAAVTSRPGPAGLNPRYTFDTFIVGSSNQFA